MDGTASSEETFEGGCLCAGLRFRVRGPARYRACCHCRSCRMASGAPFVAWATFDRPNFEILSGELRERASSSQAVRGFCATCGTSITYKPTLREDDIDISVTTLDDPEALSPQFHVWTSEKPSWLVLADGLPQFERWPGE